MASYPYYTEPSHDAGAAITLSATNYGRTTATSSTEQRLIVDAVDKIFLLEPNRAPACDSSDECRKGLGRQGLEGFRYDEESYRKSGVQMV